MTLGKFDSFKGPKTCFLTFQTIQNWNLYLNLWGQNLTFSKFQAPNEDQVFNFHICQELELQFFTFIHGQLATLKKSHLTRFHFVSTWPDDVGLTGDSKVYVEDLKDLNL